MTSESTKSSDSLKHKVLSGLLWRGLERFGTQAISFVVSVILARLLVPKDFGTITLITVFLALSNAFVDAGFGSALIRKKDADELDFNSVFYLSLAVSIFLYIILFFGAPWIATFYSEPALKWVLRLLSLGIIVGALNSIQSAILMREMKFQLLFWANLSRIIVSAVLGISIALCGMGVWALVSSSLAGQAAMTISYWSLVRWRPARMYSWKRVKGLFGFSSKLLISSLLDTLFSNLYNLVIGKLFNPTVLGYYSRGQSLPNNVMTSVNGTIKSVVFPALATCQSDLERMKSIVRRMIKTTCFLVFPLMFGLAAVSKPLVLVLLTDKWVPCIPFLQLSCITFALWPLHVANLQAINALGRSDVFLTLEVIKKALVVVVILVTFKFGVMAMVMGQAVLGFISAIINAWPNRRLLSYSFLQQIWDIFPTLMLSASMGTVVYGLGWMIDNQYLLLGTQIVVGATFYLTSARLLRIESADFLFRTGHQMLLLKAKRYA